MALCGFEMCVAAALNGGNPVSLPADQRLDFSEVEVSDKDLMAQLEAVIGGDSDDDEDANKQEWTPSFHGSFSCSFPS